MKVVLIVLLCLGVTSCEVTYRRGFTQYHIEGW
jgi:hypothetical protein